MCGLMSGEEDCGYVDIIWTLGFSASHWSNNNTISIQLLVPLSVNHFISFHVPLSTLMYSRYKYILRDKDAIFSKSFWVLSSK